MNKGVSVFLGSIIILGSILFFGCNKSKDSSTKSLPTANFKVHLNNSTTTQISSIKTLSVATSLRAKLGGVDLLNECTNGAPPGDCLDLGKAPDPDIWVNAGCNDDIAQCTTSNTQFFELIDPTAANTELNSQGRSIEVGTFTHVRVYFLNNDNNDAIECDGVANAVRPNAPITVALASPLTVAEGDSVTVTLSYDPSAVDCADQTTLTNMFSGMTASATIN